MKNILLSVLLMMSFFYGCNNGSRNAENKKDLSKDSTSNTLVNLSSSNTLPQLLCQNWEDKEDIDDDILNSTVGSLEIPFHSYCFFDDGSVVQNPRGDIKLGKWTIDEKNKQISIVFGEGSKRVFQLKAIDVKNLVLKSGKEKAVKYVADGRKYTNILDDPFYPDNNKWRIKPGQAETDSAIKQRVIQCILFYSKFFQENADRGRTAISFYGLPGCFKWYRGGITIINKDKIGQKWIDCFYNKEQAIKGQQLLENIIAKKYKWNREQANWVKQSADVLLQVADSLHSF